VVIIGGGDTGADCLGTAHRQGAASVTQLEILPLPPQARPESQPWPTYPMVYRVASAHEEGGGGLSSGSPSTTARARPRPASQAARRRAGRRAPAGGPHRSGVPRHGLHRARARCPGRPARPRARRSRDHRPGRRLRRLDAGGLRGRRRRSGPVAHRVGDRGGPRRSV
jgi:hypothetical protein